MSNSGVHAPVSSVPAAEGHDSSLVAQDINNTEISQEGHVSEGAASEEQDNRDACPPATETSSAESTWEVGARCRVVWLEDGQVYPASVLCVDGGSCRVRFDVYGNEEDVDVSLLQSPEEAPPTQKHKEWKPGSRCRAVYSEDGLVYPAVVLWVKGQRCRVRFDSYNNEEEQDVNCLLSPHALKGPSRANTKTSSWKFVSNPERRRRGSEENQGERASARKNHQQNLSWREQAKDTSADQREEEEKVEDETEGNHKVIAEKLTNHILALFPQSSPPGDAPPIIPPPPPLSMSESTDAISSLLMLWYNCGFHTGSFMAQQRSRFNSKD